MIIHIEAKSPQFRKKIEREINEFLPNIPGRTYHGKPLSYNENQIDILIRDFKVNSGKSSSDPSGCETINFSSDGYYQMDKISETCLPEFTQPIQSETLPRILHFALQRVQYKNAVPTTLAKESDQRIIIQNADALIILKSDEIMYVEAWGKYCYLYMTDGIKHILYKSLGSFINNVVDKSFVLCHKSYAVNLQHIDSIYNDVKLKLKSGHIIPLARRRRQKLISILKDSTTVHIYVKNHILDKTIEG